MMSTSIPTYKDYSFADHKEVYVILDGAFRKYNIPYYLIGANARDVQLYKAGTKPTRLTGDIDFAIMVPDFGAYYELFEYLISQGFLKSRFQYRLVHADSRTSIDFMPFGSIQEGNVVSFKNNDLTMSVLGYDQVHTHKEAFMLPDTDFSLPVSPLEGLFILKWIAWQENPSRQKDLDDLAHLLKNAWDLLSDDAYNNHLDLFDTDDFKTLNTAARILGRKMKPILAHDETLRNNITTLLEETISNKTKVGALEITFAESLKLDIEATKALFIEILKGVKEEIPSGKK